MSSKRKWDQAAPGAGQADETSNKVAKIEDGKTASEAAAAAAAIAAKIAAQFSASGGGPLDAPEAEFTQDIDINDQRNRYMLTKGGTQAQASPITHVRHIRSRMKLTLFTLQIHEETGASVSTKGVWYPDRSKATEKDPPLYLHIAAATPEVLQKAIDRVNELMAVDLGSLVEDKKDRLRERVR
jgi:hypothetical protein